MPKLKNKNRSTKPVFSEIMHMDGESILHIRHITETDEVFSSEDGETFERADVWLRAMITGIPGRDAATVDPLFPVNADRDPILRVAHEAKVKDMILYTADYYRPDLARKTSNLPMLAEAMVTVILRSQERLAALPTPYARWDMIIENFTEWLIKPPKLVPVGPRK
ncbi:hypothetical protein SAMN04488144_116138 [Methylobacterium sp. 190mf]|uniref:hypothetical protein n=1 Tax=Methylobacterium sp. 190mf TaxID=1761798 RepID=UPI00089E8B63|nr:hypothetical protein [Methylobacterium sp. 190mf]SEG41475.1 hypothetical protein SAMN04488144_116138 [Methylobacterium sp. 190mf]